MNPHYQNSNHSNLSANSSSYGGASSSPASQYQRCGGVVYPEVCLIDTVNQCRMRHPDDDDEDILSNNSASSTINSNNSTTTTTAAATSMFTPFVESPSSAAAGPNTSRSSVGGGGDLPLDRQRIFDIRNNSQTFNNQLPPVTPMRTSTGPSSPSRQQQSNSIGHRQVVSKFLSPSAWGERLTQTEVALMVRDALSASNLASIPMLCPTLSALSCAIPHLRPWTLPITESKCSPFRLDSAAVRVRRRLPDLDTSTSSSSRTPMSRMMARVHGDSSDVPTVQAIAFHPYLPVLAVCLQRNPRSAATIRLYSVTEGAYIEGVELQHGYMRGVTTMEWKRPYSKGVLAVGCSGGVLLWSIRCLEEFGTGGGAARHNNQSSFNASSTTTAAGGDSGGYDTTGGVRSGWRRGGGANRSAAGLHQAEADSSAPSTYSFGNTKANANYNYNSTSSNNTNGNHNVSSSSWSQQQPNNNNNNTSTNTNINNKTMYGPFKNTTPGEAVSAATCVCYPCANGDQGVIISSIAFAKLPVLSSSSNTYVSRDVMLCGSRQSPFVFVFDLHALPEDSLMAKIAGFEGGVSCLGVSQLAASGASAAILASGMKHQSCRAKPIFNDAKEQAEYEEKQQQQRNEDDDMPVDLNAVAVATKIVNRLFCVRGFENTKKMQVMNLGAGWTAGSTTTFDMPQPVVRVERCDVTAEDAFAIQFDSSEVVCLAVITPKQVTILANIITGVHRGVGGRALDIRVCHATLYVRVTSGHVLNISLLGSLHSNSREGKQLSAMITGGVPLGSFSSTSEWHSATPSERSYLISHLIGNHSVVAMDAFQNFQNGSLLAVVDSVSGVLKVVPTYFNRR